MFFVIRSLQWGMISYVLQELGKMKTEKRPKNCSRAE